MKTLIFMSLVIALASPALANPGMAKGAKSGEERFVQIDTGKDGQISWAEFSIALPQMRESAFKTIDKDQDGQISRTEWGSFQMGHSQDMAAPAPNSTDSKTPVVPSTPAKPSIVPPKAN